jgi:predicted transcriptional regulator
MREMTTIRVDRKTKARLEKLAKETRRSESRLAAEAIRSYVDVNEWQIAGIKEGLKEADAGKFVTKREVEATLRKLKKLARHAALTRSPAAP